MARRPDIFDKESFQASLRKQGCPESFVSPITSDLRLFVPIILRKLGEDGVFDIVDGARSEFGLGAQEDVWRLAAKHIVAWANESLAAYKDTR